MTLSYAAVKGCQHTWAELQEAVNNHELMSGAGLADCQKVQQECQERGKADTSSHPGQILQMTSNSISNAGHTKEMPDTLAEEQEAISLLVDVSGAQGTGVQSESSLGYLHLLQGGKLLREAL